VKRSSSELSCQQLAYQRSESLRFSGRQHLQK
jgi:hypothetical protein